MYPPLALHSKCPSGNHVKGTHNCPIIDYCSQSFNDFLEIDVIKQKKQNRGIWAQRIFSVGRAWVEMMHASSALYLNIVCVDVFVAVWGDDARIAPICYFMLSFF